MPWVFVRDTEKARFSARHLRIPVSLPLGKVVATRQFFSSRQSPFSDSMGDALMAVRWS